MPLTTDCVVKYENNNTRNNGDRNGEYNSEEIAPQEIFEILRPMSLKVFFIELKGYIDVKYSNTIARL